MCKVAAIFVAIILIAGCASPPSQLRPIRFFHNTATDEQFVKDRSECLKMAEWIKAKGSISGYANAVNNGKPLPKHIIPSCNIFSQCLTDRGYLETPNGNLEVTREDVIICR